MKWIGYLGGLLGLGSLLVTKGLAAGAIAQEIPRVAQIITPDQKLAPVRDIALCPLVLKEDLARAGEGNEGKGELTIAQKQARLVAVKVWTGADNWGSGIVLGYREGGYLVLTNDHVLALDPHHRVQTVDGVVHGAKRITAVDFGSHDLGLLWFADPGQRYPVARLRSPVDDTGPAVLGEGLTAAGFPFDFKTGTSLEAIAERAGAEAARKCVDGLWMLGGRVSRWLGRSLIYGYRLGYTNWVAKGMSGGPLLDELGYVVGINGKQAYPAVGDPYAFEDDTSPPAIERSTLVRSSWAIPIGVALEIMNRQGWSVDSPPEPTPLPEPTLKLTPSPEPTLSPTPTPPPETGVEVRRPGTRAIWAAFLAGSKGLNPQSPWELLGWKKTETVPSKRDEARSLLAREHLRSVVSVSIGRSLFLGVITDRQLLDGGGWRYTALISQDSGRFGSNALGGAVWVRSPEGLFLQGTVVSRPGVIAVAFDSQGSYGVVQGTGQELGQSQLRKRADWAIAPVIWDDAESFPGAPPMANFLPAVVSMDETEIQAQPAQPPPSPDQAFFTFPFTPVDVHPLLSTYFPWQLVNRTPRQIQLARPTVNQAPSLPSSPSIELPLPVFQGDRWLGWVASNFPQQAPIPHPVMTDVPVVPEESEQPCGTCDGQTSNLVNE